MGQQVGLKVQLANDFGKLSSVGLGAIIKLSSRVDELEGENARLREALAFYANEKSYQDYDEWSPGTSDVMSDHGRKAKSALEETK